MISVCLYRFLGDGVVAMGNLLRVLNDRGSVPRVDFFVDFESKYTTVTMATVKPLYNGHTGPCKTGPYNEVASLLR